MGWDRTFPHDGKASLGVLTGLVVVFLGPDIGKRIQIHESGVIFTLEGRNTWVDLRTGKVHPVPEDQKMQHIERFIEVYATVDTIFVTTRMMDEFTNSVADGLTRMLARRLEVPEDQIDWGG